MGDMGQGTYSSTQPHVPTASTPGWGSGRQAQISLFIKPPPHIQASSEVPTQLVTKRRVGHRPGHWLPCAQPLSGLGGREALPLSLTSVLLDLLSVYMTSDLSPKGLGFLKSKANYRLVSLCLKKQV